MVTGKNNVQNIRIEIEEIILDGFKQLDSNLVAAAIEQELLLFFSSYHFPVSEGENNDDEGIQINRQPKDCLQRIPSIDGGSFSLALGKIDSKSIGSSLGQSICKVLEEQQTAMMG